MAKEARMREPTASWFAVTSAVNEVEAALGKWLSQRQGLGLTDFRALVILSGAPDRELRIAELAAEVGLNQSSTTRLVARLESNGFAKRDTCPDDGRGVYAVITQAGIDVVTELTRPLNDELNRLLTDTNTHLPREAFRTIADLAR